MRSRWGWEELHPTHVGCHPYGWGSIWRKPDHLWFSRLREGVSPRRGWEELDPTHVGCYPYGRGSIWRKPDHLWSFRTREGVRSRRGWEELDPTHVGCYPCGGGLICLMNRLMDRGTLHGMTDTRSRLRVASIQMESAPNDTLGNFKKVERFASLAAAQGASLALFPECCLTGYWFIRNLNIPQLTFRSSGPRARVSGRKGARLADALVAQSGT